MDKLIDEIDRVGNKHNMDKVFDPTVLDTNGHEEYRSQVDHPRFRDLHCNYNSIL